MRPKTKLFSHFFKCDPNANKLQLVFYEKNSRSFTLALEKPIRIVLLDVYDRFCPSLLQVVEIRQHLLDHVCRRLGPVQEQNLLAASEPASTTPTLTVVTWA